MIERIEKDFPNLVTLGYIKTSNATAKYNCVAFSMGDQTRCWWPPVYDQIVSFWPEGIPQQETIEAFAALYAAAGFERCASVTVEEGTIKVALLAEPKEGLFAHACVQMSNGRWLSKMGDDEDIVHSIEGLEGPPHYFFIAQVMRCRRESAPPDLQSLLGRYGS